MSRNLGDDPGSFAQERSEVQAALAQMQGQATSRFLTATIVGLINTILPGLTPSWADYEYSVGDGGWFIISSGGLL